MGLLQYLCRWPGGRVANEKPRALLRRGFDGGRSSTARSSTIPWTWIEQHLYGSSRLGLWKPREDIQSDWVQPNGFEYTEEGSRLYELSNHLGNVMVVITDRVWNAGTFNVADVLSMQDYYTFGMLMPDRNGGVDKYRYGFNGKENDNEVKGVGNQQDYGMRVYDPRIGKFLSVDPLATMYPFYTPYQFAGNSPILAIDLDGLEPVGRAYVNTNPDAFAWRSQKIYGERNFDITGNNVRGEVSKITDAKDIAYWVVKVQSSAIVSTTYGQVRQVKVEYFYFTRPPSPNSEDYKGGEYLKFETEDEAAARQMYELCDVTGTAVFGTAFVGAALPFFAATGGPILATNLGAFVTETGAVSITTETASVFAAKAVIGGGSDYLAQLTLNENGPINWWSVGCNSLFANPWTSAATASAFTVDEKGNLGVSSGSSYVLNTALNGAAGCVAGKIMGPIAPKAGAGDNAAKVPINLLPNYWGNTGAGAAANSFSGTDQSNNSNSPDHAKEQ